MNTKTLARLFLSFFILPFMCAVASAQQNYRVNWKVDTVEKKDAKHAVVALTGTILKDWKIYDVAKALEVPGIDATVKDKTVKVLATDVSTKAIAENDPIFSSKMNVFRTEIKMAVQLEAAEFFPAVTALQLAYSVGYADNFETEEQVIKINLAVADTTTTQGTKPNRDSGFNILVPTIDIKKPLTTCGKNSASATTDTEGKGLLAIFFLGFLGGIVALITPCVFPMIPLTVSFFTKKAGSRRAGIKNAFLYGFFIFLIYILLSLPFHFLSKLNPEILNNISTNVYLNVIFFAVFIVFALSFFGLFEITLPSSISNSADSKSGSGNIIGIFFMALTLAVVSFSCTGPILGSLLAGSLSGDGGAMQLTAGMGGFGLALALPFALFALFPNWLTSLPKSGGWLTSVKIVLGFAELALAFKFLSNADLVKHWGLLKREVFIGIWIIIGILLSLYLFNLLRFKHESRVKKIPKLRLMLAVVVAAFTLYLIPGVTNTKYANLSLISGFPPPLWYSIYAQESQCVLNLNCTHDYEQGLKLAKEQNKPILLDFTGYACVNCRRMEENVWSREDIYKILKDSFIVVSLYVDDKIELPISQQTTYTTKDGQSKEIVTVGDKWATFQTENFAANSQPLYAIINTKQQLVTYPVGYANSKQLVEEYKAWLLCGIEAAKK